jgi:hypothetical protein
VFADGTGALPTTVVRLPEASFLRFSSPVPNPYDCSVAACSITAAEAVDFASTATEAAISYAPPRVLPGLGTLIEGDGGGAFLEIPVTLSAPSGLTVSADWSTIVGPGIDPPAAAEPGADFAPASGTVTFLPGVTEATIELSVTDDGLDEPDEYIVASFTNPTNAQMGGFWGLGFGLIEDDDG